MKKLILVSVLLFNVNVIAKEYNVVCGSFRDSFVISGIVDIEVAKEIVNKFNGCAIIKVKN